MPDPISAALVSWTVKQLADKTLAAVRRRRQRENDAPAVRAALLDAVKYGTADALNQAFPDNEEQQEHVRALLFDRDPNLLPLVDGTELEDLPAAAAEWIAWIETNPDEQLAPAVIDPDHPFAVQLCTEILARVRREALRGGGALGNMWLDFATSTGIKDETAEQLHISNQFDAAVGTLIQSQHIDQVNLYQLELPGNATSNDAALANAAQLHLLGGGPEVESVLRRSVDKHQRHAVRLRPDIGLIERPETEAVLNILQDENERQLVMVDGNAGIGKSAVVTAIATALEEHGWAVAFTRMDGADPAKTSRGVGTEMGLDGSPAAALLAVAAGRPALLVIDQLDAVSELSGRIPDSFEAVDEMLDEIKHDPHVKVLMACRTVDLDRDPRLRSLMRGDSAAARVHLDLLPGDRVRALLSASNAHVPTDQVVELLRTPLHLSVYCRLEPVSQEQPFRTLPDLYEQLTGQVRRRLEARAGRIDWDSITSALVSYMSRNEVLTAPSACLGPTGPNDVEALESETILVRRDGGLSFFHQTYFDYLFARAFIRAGDDLHEFLLESSQALFQRAPTRQVLDHLAATNRPAHRETVLRLLTSDAIRFHLKDIIVTDLRNLNPTGEDWTAVGPLAWDSLSISARVRSLLSSPGWFDAADSLGHWERWLADPERRDPVFMPLALVANQRGERVAELLRPYLTEGGDWRDRYITLINWSLPTELVGFVDELIGHGILDRPEPDGPPIELWPLLHQLQQTDAAGAARLVGAYLKHGLSLARAKGHTNPFESGDLEEDSTSASIIQDIAALAPVSFVHEVLPFVEAIALAEHRTPENRLPYGSQWKTFYGTTPTGVDDFIFDATESALISLTKQDPGTAVGILARLRSAESKELRYLACRALSEGGEPNESIEWLLSDDRNLLLGWSGDPHWAAAYLIKAHTADCSGELFLRLEQALLAFASPLETRRGRGYGQYILLAALDPSRISEPVRRRLGELARRFPHDPPTEPRWIHDDAEQHTVTADGAKHMSDEHWLRAFRKHYDSATDHYWGYGSGDARWFAELLEGRTLEDPERFACLALRFDSTIPAEAIESVIRGLTKQAEPELFADVCEHAAAIYGDSVGNSIAAAIDEFPSKNARTVDLLEWCAASADPAPDHTLATRNLEDARASDTGKLVELGFSTVRGRAAIACASMLAAVPEQTDRLAAIVAELAQDDHLAVRACAAYPVTRLIHMQHDGAIDLTETLLSALPGVLDASTTENLLATAILRAPQRFADSLALALEGPTAIANRAGRVWAFAAIEDSLTAPLPATVQELAKAARLGAAGQFARRTSTATRWLPELFNDPEANIRAAAAIAMRHLDELAPPDLDQLTEQFTQSIAFAEHLSHAIYGMAKLGSRLPTTALETCARAAELAGKDLGNMQTAHSAASRDLATVVLRLYRQSNAVAG
ncbi:hypothetical protein [Glycomyces sp. YM15]|uniref:hypothetical protein n=1 Tax=Glycomyces sp. YM15 TaxID=2800446 RepID=UPI001966977F|nr:hypothetical protein [Glycomyces sp. YM15]